MFYFIDVLVNKQLTVKFVQDTSKFWYKPDISRDQGRNHGHILIQFNHRPAECAHDSIHSSAAISVLKDKEPGSFIVRDSHSFRGAYGLAMKVATPPPSVLQQSKKGTTDVLLFLIAAFPKIRFADHRVAIK